MKNFVLLSATALLLSTAVFARDVPQSGPAANGSPAWFIYQAPPAPEGQAAGRGGRGGGGGGGGRGNRLANCADDIVKLCANVASYDRESCLIGKESQVSQQCKTALAPGAGYDQSRMPACVRSPLCSANAANNPEGVPNFSRVQWKSVPLNMGFVPTYPYPIPEGGGGVSAVAMDSKGNLWAFQRNAPGKPSLFKFDPNQKVLLSLGDNEIGHQDKPHGITIDSEDNVWIADANGSTIKQISPDGKVLKTIGTKNKRGDWVESKGQRLLWQPMAMAFAKNGDMYIAEGHANESPNDVGSDDPTNTSGASRIIQLDKNGTFIRQWYGNITGPGRFYQAHGIGIDPLNGDVWIGDRENYRLVVYTAEGKFLKTISMRNLICNVTFDPQGNLWVGTGQDAQLLKLDRNGKVLQAIGNGPGRGPGNVIETAYPIWDKQGNIYQGDTSVGRVTKWVAPKNQARK